MPPPPLAALIPVFIGVLMLVAICIKVDPSSPTILVLATGFAGAVVGAFGLAMWWKNRKKVQRAEEIAPGITSIPKGSETTATVVVNDPEISNISHTNPKTP